MSYTAHIDPSGLDDAINAQLAALASPQAEVYREVVLDLIAQIHERIHVDGEAADGSQIGTYTNAYMAVRTGTFGNSTRFAKGKNKGKVKNAGTATKGKDQGAPRKQYNRSADTKVILSLTRQLENDYAVVPIDGGWGIGFNNGFNADKARWNDERYGKKIFALTDAELDHAVRLTQDLVTKNLNP